jgi:tRNA pseudouridine55 synthase
VKKVIVLNKREGETPLEALGFFREKNKKYENAKLTYAGRLDPMASGVLVALAGEEIKNKEKYLALDKEYNFSVLFGFSTDTYDILGKVIVARQQTFFGKQELALPLRASRSGPSKSSLPRSDFLVLLIKNNLKYFRGKLKQKYPIYSSKTVKGKPLFSYARSKESVEIPETDILIKKLTFEKIKKITGDKLFLNIKKRIKKVKGNFRQEEILKIWQEKLLGENKSRIFYIAEFVVKCTSGTYVRGLANSLGEKMKIPALAFSIKRTKVGKFHI